MQIREVMTADPVYCVPDTNLAEVAQLMWKSDCGVMPVTENGKLTGVLTDRDICIALGTRDRPAHEIAAGDVATHRVETCLPSDDVQSAMATMERAKVRRLPVIGIDGSLEGIVALSDIVIAADRGRGKIAAKELLHTISAVSAPVKTKTPAPHVVAAAG